MAKLWQFSDRRLVFGMCPRVSLGWLILKLGGFSLALEVCAERRALPFLRLLLTIIFFETHTRAERDGKRGEF